MTDQTTTYSNRQIANLWGVINELQNDTTKMPTKFLLGLTRNKNLIKPDIDAFTELQKPDPSLTEKLNEYEQARIALCVEYSEKDADGNAVKTVIDAAQKLEEYSIPTDKRGEFNKAFLELNQRYSETITEFNKKQQDFVDLMNAESPLTNLIKISENDLPEQLTPQQVEALAIILL